jgi:hypothetical protein
VWLGTLIGPRPTGWAKVATRGKNTAGLAALPFLVAGFSTFQLSSSFINPTDSAPPYNTLLNMSTQGQKRAITFAPACIGTSLVDAEFKLGYLRKALKDESFLSQRQRKNIEFLIHYYENGGKLPPPGQTMWLLDGKVVDKMPEKIPEGSAVWAEEVCLPLTPNFILITCTYLYLGHGSSSQ